MSDKIKISLIKDGPALIENAGEVVYCGERLDVDGNVALCRCGESSKQPFCDGTHGSCGYSDENELASEKRVPTKEWNGKTLSTRFDPNQCNHVYFCKPMKDLRQRDADGENVDKEIMDVVSKCPTGALSYFSNTKEVALPPSSNTVEIVEGGEIRIQSSFECEEIDQEYVASDNRLAICRCGLSKNKPFCDARHRKKENYK